MQYGLLGQKLSHSYSPQIHKALASYEYGLIQIEPEDLESFLRTADFSGINVTIPYKKAVLPFCQSLSPQARRLGAVNTIVKKPDGTLWGHNTDYFGFQEMVRLSGLNIQKKKVLVLGSGGAGVTATAVLQDLGANVICVSRSGENNYDNLGLHKDASVIVNATPVGMYPNTGVAPLQVSAFPNLEGVLDLIYNPSKTDLLLQAEEKGLIALNGLYMLVAQAKESAECFCGNKISDSKIEGVHKYLKSQMENIVLIGMPGSGKSTIGALLADSLNRCFIDTDQLIMERTGVPIPSFMEKYGLERFRQEESSVIHDVCKQSGLVISTGGGCVTREENYKLLRQNGTVVWIMRDIGLLPTDGRPLSQSGDLQTMYEERKPLYSRFADIHVDNDQTPEKAAERILAALKGD